MVSFSPWVVVRGIPGSQEIVDDVDSDFQRLSETFGNFRRIKVWYIPGLRRST